MKEIKQIFVAFALFFVFGIASVSAETVNVANETDLQNCVAITGAECKLTDDINMNGYAFVNNKSVTLNLDKYNITAPAVAFYVAGENAKLTIKGSGTITSDDTSVYAYQGANVVLESGNLNSGDSAVVLGYTTDKTSATMVMNGGTIEAQEVGVLALVDSVFTMNDGTITTKDNFAVGGNGMASYVKEKGITVTINGGTLNGNIQSSGYASCGIYFPQVGTLNINGGKINSSKGAGIVLRGGKLNITGGTINASGESNFVGKVGDSRVVIPVSAIVIDKQAKYTDYKNIETKISGKAVINGAKEPITFLAATDDSNANVLLSSGTYNNIVSEEYLANGKALYKISNDKYIIDAKSTIKAEDKIALVKGSESSNVFTITGANHVTVTSSDNIISINGNKIKALKIGKTTLDISSNDVYNNSQKQIEVLVYEIEAEDSATKSNEQAISDKIKEVLEGNNVKGIDEATANAIKTAVENGQTITTEVTTETISKTDVSSQETELIANKLNTNEQIIGYFNINFILKVNDDEIGTVTEISKPITLTLNIPNNLEAVKKAI